MSFASLLTKVVADKQRDVKDRAESTSAWRDHEKVLLDRLVESFKGRCVLAAESQKTEALVSFEVLTRDIDGFPKRVLRDGAFYVDRWPKRTSAEIWFYANHGTQTDYTGAPILFAEVLDRLMGKFLDTIQSFGFESCKRQAGSWKALVVWGKESSRSSFAGSLVRTVAEKAKEETRRAEVAIAWSTYESMLLDLAAEKFKVCCTRAASASKTNARVSFDLLSREIPEFPKRTLRDEIFYVDEWPKGVTAESWFYCNNGPKASFSDSSILYAEVLDRMMPKFFARVQALGFSSCEREAGTWKIKVSWAAEEKTSKKDEHERPAKRARQVSLVGGA